MIKFLLRTAVIAIAGLTFLVSSLSAFKPETLYRSQVAVLMYHHIHDTDQSGATITTELFRSQLSYLKGRGYHFISLQEFKDFMNGAAVPDNAVLVTFDDGYEGFYQNAYPVLTKLNIPAVNFIITGTLDHPLAGNIPFLNRDEIRIMTSHSPGIEVQCHTDSLHGKTEGDQGKALLVARLPKDGRTETEDEYKKRIVDDTRACTGRLKDLTPHQVDAMAYPYGIYNPLAASLVKEGGIQYAFTILPRMATQGMDPLRIPRINAGSPYITPLALHNMIMRRVTAPGPPRAWSG
ncbi:polysaccharide deacetylase family protein [Paenibacillus sp. CC-CFT747]|nr:polysaccharide deacetylase family protein [Paenibacillus sp. CC-CFT747]